ncbi:MAG: hypothetical protein LBP62_01840 [Clostridiales bacterium]|nr:hypothetical protein [Clostridiales bacterium]
MLLIKSIAFFYSVAPPLYPLPRRGILECRPLITDHYLLSTATSINPLLRRGVFIAAVYFLIPQKTTKAETIRGVFLL